MLLICSICLLVCIFWLTVWFIDYKVHYLECSIGFICTVVVLLVLVPLLCFFNCLDTCTHSSRYMSTTYYPKWVEETTSVDCDKDSNGNTTCTTSTDYITHPKHWSAKDTKDVEYDISEQKFNEIRMKFGNNKHTLTPVKPGFYKGDKHIYTYYNDTNTYEYPITYIKTWNNYRKTSSISLFSETHMTHISYPQRANQYISNRFNVVGSDITSKDWDILNTKLAEGALQSNELNVIAFQVKDIQQCPQIEADWMDGKYNDIIICFEGNPNDINNSYIIGWENELLRQKLNTFILEKGLKKCNLEELLILLRDWKRPDLDRYKYLSVNNLPPVGKIFIVIIIIVLQIILYIKFVDNDFNQGDI